MAKLITEMVGGEVYQYYPLGEHVVRAVGVCGGRPTFKYTRIEITGTLERLAAGESIDEIVRGYRGRVSREAIVMVIEWADLHRTELMENWERAREGHPLVEIEPLD